MSLAIFVALFGFVVIASFGFILIYEPSVSGDYQGTAEDGPNGAVGEIRLTLNEEGGKLTGRLALPANMPDGGGDLAGVVKGEKVFFVTTDAAGTKMTWVAHKTPRSLAGNYWWGELDEAHCLEATALGTWNVSRP